MRAAGLDDARIAAGMAACFEAYVAELEALIGDGARVSVMPGVGRASSARWPPATTPWSAC